MKALWILAAVAMVSFNVSAKDCDSGMKRDVWGNCVIIPAFVCYTADAYGQRFSWTGVSGAFTHDQVEQYSMEKCLNRSRAPRTCELDYCKSF